jgi:SAM-dependent methyltransferase
MFSTPRGAYDRHIGRYGRELARALTAAAGVRPGQRALDVGCGPGALTEELVALLGADQVTAVDPSDAFVQACRRRLPGVRVEVAAAEALPLEDAAVDHALAQLVVNFMADPPTGVREMRRVTRPGGTVAAAVWDYAGEMTLLRRFWDAVVALDPVAAERDEGRSMAFCTPRSSATCGPRRGSRASASPRSSSTRATTASRTSGSRSSSAWGRPAPTSRPCRRWPDAR